MMSHFLIQMILKSPTDKSNCVANLRFTRNARTAWEHILRTVSPNSKPKVLLPAYIGYTEREGSGVFDPIEATSAESVFYRLTNNLAIDTTHFEEVLCSGRVNIALVIHYFGFCRNNMERVKERCRNNNVILVEDCAHAFHLGHRGSTVGNYGEFSFYSLHKHLPTTSGGILKINSDGFDVLPLSSFDKAPLPVVEQYAISEFQDIATRRRDNFRRYQLLLPKHEELEVMYELEDEDIPQSFPVRIKNGRRETLYFYLMERCMPTTALYYRLISQIGKEEFPLSHNISDEILNLPVHQDTTMEDIRCICEQIQEFLALKLGQDGTKS